VSDLAGDREWGDQLSVLGHVDDPASVTELRRLRAVYMDRVTSIDDLLAERAPAERMTAPKRRSAFDD
jgi:hypothetical protein